MWLTNLIQTLQTALADLNRISTGNPTPPGPVTPTVPTTPTTPHAPIGTVYQLGTITDFMSTPYAVTTPCTLNFTCTGKMRLTWVPDVNTLKKVGAMKLVVDGKEYNSNLNANTELSAGLHNVSFVPDPALGYVALWTVFRNA